MNSQEIRQLYSYHRWANGRMLEACGRLSAEEATRRIESSFPSVLATLVHMLSADWIWLQRWQGYSPTSFKDEGSLTSMPALRARWSQIERELTAFVESRKELDLTVPCSYKSTKGEPFTNPLVQLFQHVVNHGTYHRGQVATMVRQLGQTPPGTDYILYLREQPVLPRSRSTPS